MTAAALLCDLWQCGLYPQAANDGQHLLVPEGRLSDAQRDQLAHYKAQVLEVLTDPLTNALMAASMNACGYWQDSPEARAQMRLEILETRAEHRQELLNHFNQEYPCTR